MNEKTECAAFGCHRWTRRLGPGSEYICPAHWSMVPARLRRLYGRANRRAERAPTQRDVERVYRLWEKCRTSADRNLGVSL